MVHTLVQKSSVVCSSFVRLKCNNLLIKYSAFMSNVPSGCVRCFPRDCWPNSKNWFDWVVPKSDWYVSYISAHWLNRNEYRILVCSSYNFKRLEYSCLDSFFRTFCRTKKILWVLYCQWRQNFCFLMNLSFSSLVSNIAGNMAIWTNLIFSAVILSTVKVLVSVV